jgi:predicted transcriptional regulator
MAEPQLSRRERQIMDVVYRRGRATAAEILEGIPDPPSYSAVRAMLRVLEDNDGRLADEEIDRLSRLVDKAKEEGR